MWGKLKNIYIYVLNKHMKHSSNLPLQINENFTLDVDWSIQIVDAKI